MSAMGFLLALVRMAAVVIVYPGFAIVGGAAGFLSRKRRHRLMVGFTRLWARCSCFIFNIRVRTVGDLKAPSNSLIVANHIGVSDIFVLGSCFPGFFVSKAEIAEWPFFRWLARLGNTIFAERSKRSQVREIIAQMRERFEDGCSVILFPEGGATDGERVVDFKSSVFEGAVLAGSPVVPVTIIYRDGRRPSIACWHETPFLSHILRLLKNFRLDVTVIVHEKISGEVNRRVLAEGSCRIIRETHHKEMRR